MNVEAETPLRQRYVVGGAVCEVSTNSTLLLAAVSESFLPLDATPEPVDCSLRIWADDNHNGQPPWPKPYARGIGHLVFVAFDPSSSMVLDLHRRRVSGRFSAAFVADKSYLRAVVFPMMLSILGASLGVVELHSACVVKDAKGMLLIGPSGSGKSTLSVALARREFGFLSDDRVYCSRANGGLVLFGVHSQLKLRRDAGTWFGELQDHEPAESHKGEAVFKFSPETILGLTRVARCEPSCLVLLERTDEPSAAISRISSERVAGFLRQELIAEFADTLHQSFAIIDALTQLPCWLLRHGKHPDAVAEELADHFSI
jgi:hypothetical protein